MPPPAPLVFRCTRSDFPDEPSDGWNPLPGIATWHVPPGEWRVTVVSLTHLLQIAAARECDLVVRPHLDPDDLPHIVVNPLPTFRTMMGEDDVTYRRPRRWKGVGR